MAKNKSGKKNIPPTKQSTRELVPLNVGGVDYMVRPPKGYVGLVLAKQFQALGDDTKGKKGKKGKEADFDPNPLIEAVQTMITAIFTKADAQKVNQRLLDGGDDLDFPDLTDAFTSLVGTKGDGEDAAEEGSTPTM